MLEALEHEYNAFVTLTYRNVPGDGSVSGVVLRQFLGRLRERYARENLKFRYYGVGEYGEIEERPHYHVALFGFPSCVNGSQFYDGSKQCCPACDMVYSSWQKGRVQLGTLTQESAAYIAGYVTKKLLSRSDGLHAPFARMSNRPGIGAGAMDDVASALLMAKFDGTDVPTSLIQGGKSWPLGRYLRRRLRERIGRSKDAPEETLAAMVEEMRELREAAFTNSRPFKEEIANAGKGKRAKQEFWQRLREQRKTL